MGSMDSVFCLYFDSIANGIFSREPGSRVQVSLRLFETWGHTFHMHAFFIENIIMFIPLGVFLPILFARSRRMWLCVFIGFFGSCVIEIAQFFTQRGYFQVDDVFTNSVGTLIGWMVWRYIYVELTV